MYAEIKRALEPGMVVHTCVPSTWEAKAKVCKFRVNLSYRVRHEKGKLSMS
jgi:hypothetical protein